jgi:hypothetical protein
MKGGEALLIHSNNMLAHRSARMQDGLQPPRGRGTMWEENRNLDGKLQGLVGESCLSGAVHATKFLLHGCHRITL